MDFPSKTLTVIVFAAAMGYLEAAVVVYLRTLFYPDGFSFPPAVFPHRILLVETAREAATIFMIAAVGTLAGRRFWERFGWFLAAFGVWDIVYYAGLKNSAMPAASAYPYPVLFIGLILYVWAYRRAIRY